MAEFGHEYSNTLNPTVLGEGSNRLSWPTSTSYCTWATSPTLRTAPHGQPQDGGNNVLVSEEGTSGCVDPSRLQINPSNIRPPGRFWSSYHLDFLVSCYSPPQQLQRAGLLRTPRIFIIMQSRIGHFHVLIFTGPEQLKYSAFFKCYNPCKSLIFGGDFSGQYGGCSTITIHCMGYLYPTLTAVIAQSYCGGARFVTHCPCANSGPTAMPHSLRRPETSGLPKPSSSIPKIATPKKPNGTTAGLQHKESVDIQSDWKEEP
jgi:hypothetical protein